MDSEQGLIGLTGCFLYKDKDSPEVILHLVGDRSGSDTSFKQFKEDVGLLVVSLEAEFGEGANFNTGMTDADDMSRGSMLLSCDTYKQIGPMVYGFCRGYVLQLRSFRD